MISSVMNVLKRTHGCGVGFKVLYCHKENMLDAENFISFVSVFLEIGARNLF